jgi:hypothetical protein
MTLFKELPVTLDDVRGMGIILSRLTSNQDPGHHVASGHGIENWLKKGKQSDAKSNAGAHFQQQSGLLDLSSHNEKSDNLQRLGAASKRHRDTRCPSPPDLLALSETYPGVTEDNCDDTMDPLVSSLPKHLRRDILNDDENCFSGDSNLLASMATGVDEEFLAVEEVHPSTGLDLKEGHLDTDESDRPERSALYARGNASEATSTYPQHFTQIALPPLSQIRMSQVEALPPELQAQILPRIQGGTLASGHDQDCPECIDVDAPTSSEAAQIEVEEFDNREQEGEADEGQNMLSLEQSMHRLRQTNLKRMMKLAAVKSGQETTNISLTQLDHLPLEIKLQVVNDDDGPVGFLSPRKAKPSSGKKYHSTPANALKEDIQGIETHEHQPREDNSESESVEAVCAMACQVVTTDEKIDVASDEPLLEPPRNLYEEDVLPLKLFLDENPTLNPEATVDVVEFLSICLREGRLRDVVILVRSIRNRQDDWSRKIQLKDIVESLDKVHFQVHGTHLDIDWLLGAKS